MEEINRSKTWDLPVDWSKPLQKATKIKYGHKNKSAWLNSMLPQTTQELRAHGPKFVLLLCGDPRLDVSQIGEEELQMLQIRIYNGMNALFTEDLTQQLRRNVSATSKTQATDAYNYLNKMDRSCTEEAQRAINKLGSMKMKDGWNFKQFEENFRKLIDTINVADDRLMPSRFQLAILFMDAMPDDGPNAGHWRRRKDMLGMAFKTYDEDKLGDPLKFAIEWMEDAHNSVPLIRKGEDIDIKKTTSLLKRDQMKTTSKEKQKLLKEGRCFNCKQQGHKQSECPELKEKAEKVENRRIAQLKKHEKNKDKEKAKAEESDESKEEKNDDSKKGCRLRFTLDTITIKPKPKQMVRDNQKLPKTRRIEFEFDSVTGISVR